MYDLTASGTSFNSTSVVIEPLTEKGKTYFEKRYGLGACGVTIRKSSAFAFILEANETGLSVKYSD